MRQLAEVRIFCFPALSDQYIEIHDNHDPLIFTNIFFISFLKSSETTLNHPESYCII
jgi:hypothetical protein